MQASSPEQQTGQDSRSARRRLIRGTFAAPVALTLASGSVAAASLTCVAKRVATPVLPSDGDTTQTWIRVAVWELKPNGANNDSFWISGADIFALAKNPLTSFISQTQWYCLSKDSNAKMNSPAGADSITLVAGTAYTPNPSPPQSGSGGALATATASTTRLVAIRVNAAGDIIGVVGDGVTAGSGITASCWTSFRR